MVNLYAKIECSLCHETVLGREIECSIGSGMFEEPICKKCVKANYCWATHDELITDFEKNKYKLDRLINTHMLELGGILTLER